MSMCTGPNYRLMLFSCFDPPESPVQFVNEDELCEHDSYKPDCLYCLEEIEATISDIKIKERKEDENN